MNKAILVGRLTAGPRVTYTQANMCIARYTLAVDRKFKKDGEPEADFIGCVTFGKSAEAVEKYLKKGTKICACGHIQTGSYTNKDGNKVYTTDVIVDEWEFAESKSTEKLPATTPGSDEFMAIPDDIDELPFV